MVKSDHFNFFAIFKMAADAILNYAKAYKVPVRDSLDLDSRHIKLPFHKFSAIYIFFPFDNLKKSNDLGLRGQVFYILVHGIPGFISNVYLGNTRM